MKKKYVEPKIDEIKINAQNGTIAVKVGDTVNVGTTLINGWMEGKYTGTSSLSVL